MAFLENGEHTNSVFVRDGSLWVEFFDTDGDHDAMQSFSKESAVRFATAILNAVEELGR